MVQITRILSALWPICLTNTQTRVGTTSLPAPPIRNCQSSGCPTPLTAVTVQCVTSFPLFSCVYRLL